jgi:hypothetical protein
MNRLLAFVLFAHAILNTSCTTCRNSLISRAESPTTGVAANIIARTCNSASGYVVTLTTQNEAPIHGDVPAGETVFWAFVEYGSDARTGTPSPVRTDWLSSKQLRVTYPSWLTPNEKQERWGDILILYVIETTPAPSK